MNFESTLDVDLILCNLANGGTLYLSGSTASVAVTACAFIANAATGTSHRLDRISICVNCWRVQTKVELSLCIRAQCQ